MKTPNSKPHALFYASNAELVEILGAEIIQRLVTAIKAKGNATLVVSGGSTPQALFQYLSKQDIEWNRVHVTLADERCLPQQDQNSNARLLRDFLLREYAAQASFIPLYENDETAGNAAINASQRLSGLGVYDVVVLGLGTDGHTASLFPEASNLSQAMAIDAPDCMAIDPVTNSMLRVTQTKQRLLNSNCIYFHVVGENKVSILNEVICDATCQQYPAAHFIHQNKSPVTIFFAQTK